MASTQDDRNNTSNQQSVPDSADGAFGQPPTDQQVLVTGDPENDTDITKLVAGEVDPGADSIESIAAQMVDQIADSQQQDDSNAATDQQSQSVQDANSEAADTQDIDPTVSAVEQAMAAVERDATEVVDSMVQSEGLADDGVADEAADIQDMSDDAEQSAIETLQTGNATGDGIDGQVDADELMALQDIADAAAEEQALQDDTDTTEQNDDLTNDILEQAEDLLAEQLGDMQPVDVEDDVVVLADGEAQAAGLADLAGDTEDDVDMQVVDEGENVLAADASTAVGVADEIADIAPDNTLEEDSTEDAMQDTQDDPVALAETLSPESAFEQQDTESDVDATSVVDAQEQDTVDESVDVNDVVDALGSEDASDSVDEASVVDAVEGMEAEDETPSPDNDADASNAEGGIDDELASLAETLSEQMDSDDPTLITEESQEVAQQVDDAADVFEMEQDAPQTTAGQPEDVENDIENAAYQSDSQEAIDDAQQDVDAAGQWDDESPEQMFDADDVVGEVAGQDEQDISVNADAFAESTDTQPKSQHELQPSDETDLDVLDEADGFQELADAVVAEDEQNDDTNESATADSDAMATDEIADAIDETMNNVLEDATEQLGEIEAATQEVADIAESLQQEEANAVDDSSGDGDQVQDAMADDDVDMNADDSYLDQDASESVDDEQQVTPEDILTDDAVATDDSDNVQAAAGDASTEDPENASSQGLAPAVDNALKDMAQGFQQLTSMMGQISAAICQQTEGINDIRKGLANAGTQTVAQPTPATYEPAQQPSQTQQPVNKDGVSAGRQRPSFDAQTISTPSSNAASTDIPFDAGDVSRQRPQNVVWPDDTNKPAAGRILGSPFVLESKGGERYASQLIAHHDRGGVITEEYRTLRTSLLAQSSDQRFCYIVTSAEGGEGKTITCLNLSFVMAELIDRRTIIVDCDLRHNQMARMIDAEDNPGIADVLRGTTKLRDAIQRTAYPNVCFLPAGNTRTGKVGELLGRTYLRQIVNTLRAKFDYVLIDTPPITSVSDAGMVGQATGEALLVARMNRTRRASVEQGLRLLRAANVNVGGIVLTHRKTCLLDYIQRYV